MSRKREILELRTADERRALVGRFELAVKDRRARDGMNAEKAVEAAR